MPRKKKIGDIRESKTINLELSNLKEAAYYQELVAAWINTRMEQDRSLLNISVAGIGLFITLITTSKQLWFCSLAFAVLAMLSFLFATILILIIFSKNTSYIEEAMQSEGKQEEHTFIDILKNICFGLGIVFAIIFVIVFIIKSVIIAS